MLFCERIILNMNVLKLFQPFEDYRRTFRSPLYSNIESIVAQCTGSSSKLVRIYYFEVCYIRPDNFDYKTHFRASCVMHGELQISMSCTFPEPTIDMPLFIKSAPKLYFQQFNRQIRNMLISNFETELRFYLEVLPALHQMQQVFGTASVIRAPVYYSNDVRNIFPLCYGVMPYWEKLKKKPNQFLITLQRLDGYFRLDTVETITFEIAKCVIEKMAKFHAVSLSSKLSNFRGTFLNNCEIRECNYYKTFIQPALRHQNMCNRQHVEMILKIVKVMIELKPHFILIKQALESSENFLRVPTEHEDWTAMCHGMLSPFNIMIQINDEGAVTDCKFIDMKHITKKHVLTDFVFFLMTCCGENLLMRHYLDLARIYFNIFKDVLQEHTNVADKYDDFFAFVAELEYVFRVELLNALVHGQFLSAKDQFCEDMRSRASVSCEHIANKVNHALYRNYVKNCLLNLINSSILLHDLDCSDVVSETHTTVHM